MSSQSIFRYDCLSKSLFHLYIGGNGSGQGNDTEDEDHEFFDAMEEEVSSAMEDKTSFVIKVPVSKYLIILCVVN